MGKNSSLTATGYVDRRLAQHRLCLCHFALHKNLQLMGQYHQTSPSYKQPAGCPFFFLWTGFYSLTFEVKMRSMNVKRAAYNPKPIPFRLQDDDVISNLSRWFKMSLGMLWWAEECTSPSRRKRQRDVQHIYDSFIIWMWTFTHAVLPLTGLQSL